MVDKNFADNASVLDGRGAFRMFFDEELQQHNAREMSDEELDETVRCWGDYFEPEEDDSDEDDDFLDDEDDADDSQDDSTDDSDGSDDSGSSDDSDDSNDDSDDSDDASDAPDDTDADDSADGGDDNSGSGNPDTQPVNPVPDPSGNPSGSQDTQNPAAQPAPAPQPKQAPPAPPTPVRSSASFNARSYEEGVQIMAEELRNGKMMIDYVANDGSVTYSMERIAISVAASDKQLGANILRAWQYMQDHAPKYEMKEFFFILNDEGQHEPGSRYFASFDEAKRKTWSEQDLKELESYGVSFDLLIGSEQYWVNQKTGKRIQPATEGKPEAPLPRPVVTSDLIHNGQRYLDRLYDTHVVEPALGKLFGQIILSDPKRVEELKRLMAENDKKRIQVAYWATYDKSDLDSQGKKLFQTKDAATRYAYQQRCNQLGSEKLALIRRGGGHVDPPRFIRACAVYVDKNGNIDGLVPLALANEYKKEHGYM